jgi:hypothetical protein
VCRGHDKHDQAWQHLDLAVTKTTLRFKVGRIGCPQRGVKLEQAS